MGLTIRVHHPHFDADKLFGLFGVEAKNDDTPHDVPENVESEFAAEHGVLLKDNFANHPYIKVEGTSNPDVTVSDPPAEVSRSNATAQVAATTPIVTPVDQPTSPEEGVSEPNA